MTSSRAKTGAWRRVFGTVPAIVLYMCGVVAAALFLVAIGGGFEGWAVVAAIAAVALFAFGVFLQRGAKYFHPQSRTVTYAPDFPDQQIDVDTKTGERHPHEA